MNIVSRYSILILFVLFTQNGFAQEQKTPRVIEIGIAVNDIQAATKKYQQIMGITHWQIADLFPADTKQQLPSVRVARGKFGDLQIALLQPLAGDSLLKSHLAKNGSSIFHLGVSGFIDIKEFTHESVSTRQNFSGSWIDSYAELGVNLFAHETDFLAVDYWGETQLDKSPINNEPRRVLHLGIVTNDIVENAMSFLNTLGVGPWLRVDFKDPHLSNSQYIGAKGKIVPFIKIAYAMWGDLQIELLQPISGVSPHRDFLINNGPGAHHLKIDSTKDHDKLVQHYLGNGLSILMQSDNGGAGRTATYMNTVEELGFVLELTRGHTGLGTLPVVGSIPQAQ